ncbi:hypothetical protein AcW2_004388 [Taiwanofungus camphoratus]|nr:hypothetical protein AcW2_004388 [Antrodia cinnamomea]
MDSHYRLLYTKQTGVATRTSSINTKSGRRTCTRKRTVRQFDRLSSREQGPDGGPTARVPFGRATTHAHAGPSGTGMHGLAPDDTAPLAAGSRGMRGGPSGERRLARGWGARRPGALRRQDPGRLLCPSAQPPVLAAAAEHLRPPGTSLVSPHALFTWWVRGDADFQCS